MQSNQVKSEPEYKANLNISQLIIKYRSQLRKIFQSFFEHNMDWIGLN